MRLFRAEIFILILHLGAPATNARREPDFFPLWVQNGASIACRARRSHPLSPNPPSARTVFCLVSKRDRGVRRKMCCMRETSLTQEAESDTGWGCRLETGRPVRSLSSAGPDKLAYEKS